MRISQTGVSNRESVVIALFPILILVGTSLRTLLVIGALLLSGEIASRGLMLGGLPSRYSGLAMAATLISLAGLASATTGSFLVGVSVLVLLVGGAGLILLLKLQSVETALSPSWISSRSVSLYLPMLFSFTLVILGWTSLIYYATGITLATLFRSVFSGWLRVLPTLALPAMGFLLSHVHLPRSAGQFWISYDQLFRSAHAAGLVDWGMHEHIGLVGTSFRYHWLGEASAGFLARISGISTIESVNRLTPAIGTLVCIVALIELGSRFGFSRTASGIGAVLAMTLGQHFPGLPLYSVGSIWGICLFLVGLIALDDLGDALLRNVGSYLTASFIIAVLTSLITMAQSTLGAHFVLASAMMVGLQVRPNRSTLFRGATAVAIQIVVLLVLRRTLLSSEADHPFQPTISPRNLLQFRGIEIYVGANLAIVATVSVLFLFVISQILTGVMFASRRLVGDRKFLRFFACVAFSSLLLANVVSIDGFDAEQARFFAPLLTVGVFGSFALFFRELRNVGRGKILAGKSLALVATTAIMTTTVVALSKYLAFSSPWSQARTLTIALLVVATQFAVVVVTTMRFKFRSRTVSLLSISFLLGIALSADFRQISNFINLAQLPSSSVREDQFIGGGETRRCLNLVHSLTTRNSIVASNLIRLPIQTRDFKYFLVSASTERRAFVEGPLYLLENQKLVEERVNIVDEFAAKPSQRTLLILESAGVDLFIIDRTEPAAMSWEPYAKTLLKTDSCIVLQLSA